MQSRFILKFTGPRVDCDLPCSVAKPFEVVIKAISAHATGVSEADEANSAPVTRTLGSERGHHCAFEDVKGPSDTRMTRPRFDRMSEERNAPALNGLGDNVTDPGDHVDMLLGVGMA